MLLAIAKHAFVFVVLRLNSPANAINPILFLFRILSFVAFAFGHLLSTQEDKPRQRHAVDGNWLYSWFPCVSTLLCSVDKTTAKCGHAPSSKYPYCIIREAEIVCCLETRFDKFLGHPQLPFDHFATYTIIYSSPNTQSKHIVKPPPSFSTAFFFLAIVFA